MLRSLPTFVGLTLFGTVAAVALDTAEQMFRDRGRDKEKEMEETRKYERKMRLEGYRLERRVVPQTLAQKYGTATGGGRYGFENVEQVWKKGGKEEPYIRPYNVLEQRLRR